MHGGQICAVSQLTTVVAVQFFAGYHHCEEVYFDAEQNHHDNQLYQVPFESRNAKSDGDWVLIQLSQLSRSKFDQEHCPCVALFKVGEQNMEVMIYNRKIYNQCKFWIHRQHTHLST